jgi:hypothetical protein
MIGAKPRDHAADEAGPALFTGLGPELDQLPGGWSLIESEMLSSETERDILIEGVIITEGAVLASRRASPH